MLPFMVQLFFSVSLHFSTLSDWGFIEVKVIWCRKEHIFPPHDGWNMNRRVSCFYMCIGPLHNDVRPLYNDFLWSQKYVSLPVKLWPLTLIAKSGTQGSQLQKNTSLFQVFLELWQKDMLFDLRSLAIKFWSAVGRVNFIEIFS